MYAYIDLPRKLKPVLLFDSLKPCARTLTARSAGLLCNPCVLLYFCFCMKLPHNAYSASTKWNVVLLFRFRDIPAFYNKHLSSPDHLFINTMLYKTIYRNLMYLRFTCFGCCYQIAGSRE